MGDWHFIAVEGVIGVGKTTLATLLSKRLNGKLVLEEVNDNPFLPMFYDSPERYSFVTQIFFLLSRYNTLRELTTRDIFSKVIVSDYMFEKDKIFASINLNDRERLLYENIYSLLKKDIPSPDIIIYLQADTSILLERIKSRGRPYENGITPEYLNAINDAYNEFFFHYEEAPILIINSNNISFTKQPEALEILLQQLDRLKKGLNFFSMA